ncbi:hypothetical protein C2G38_2184600 [Gigaspora rosea]|uniref:RNase H type-1 domain-containing protein n=1 Tax=Gigaspora rosea TaxID=44941 RepID=A0A397VAT5_9GLOM|nr:hypothetical protein C2G38_2184600 [Gigaspora rosea]
MFCLLNNARKEVNNPKRRIFLYEKAKIVTGYDSKSGPKKYSLKDTKVAKKNKEELLEPIDQLLYNTQIQIINKKYRTQISDTSYIWLQEWINKTKDWTMEENLDKQDTIRNHKFNQISEEWADEYKPKENIDPNWYKEGNPEKVKQSNDREAHFEGTLFRRITRRLDKWSNPYCEQFIRVCKREERGDMGATTKYKESFQFNDSTLIALSKKNLQIIIRKAEEFYRLNDIEVNPKKTELLVLNSKLKKEEQFVEMGKAKEVVWALAKKLELEVPESNFTKEWCLKEETDTNKTRMHYSSNIGWAGSIKSLQKLGFIASNNKGNLELEFKNKKKRRKENLEKKQIKKMTQEKRALTDILKWTHGWEVDRTEISSKVYNKKVDKSTNPNGLVKCDNLNRGSNLEYSLVQVNEKRQVVRDIKERLQKWISSTRPELMKIFCSTPIAPDNSKVVIRSNSQATIGTIRKRNVTNRTKKIKAHSGEEFNERADALAKLVCSEKETTKKKDAKSLEVINKLESI